MPRLLAASAPPYLREELSVQFRHVDIRSESPCAVADRGDRGSLVWCCLHREQPRSEKLYFKIPRNSEF